MSKRGEFFGAPRPETTLTCGYDAGHDDRPTCGHQATWHGWTGTPPDTRGDASVWACEEHFDVLGGKLWDYHEVGGACGMPGARWFNGAEQGQGYCRHDLDNDSLDIAMLEPVKELAQ